MCLEGFVYHWHKSRGISNMGFNGVMCSKYTLSLFFFVFIAFL